MFKIKQSATYFWPVTVFVPSDGGQFEKATFDAEFKRMTLDELQAMAEDDLDGKRTTSTILLGWKGVVGDDGEEIPFSETARDDMLAWSFVRTAVLNAFRESLVAAPRKN